MPAKGSLICCACGQRSGSGLGGREPLERGPRCRNWWCSQPGRPLGAVYSEGTYTGRLRSAIVSYKYRADLRWARVFGDLLCAYLFRHPTWFEELAVICPLPSYVGPGARRAWGHVELFCAELGRQSGGQWPVEPLLKKSAETEPMSAKPGAVRHQIAFRRLPGTFARDARYEVAGRRILLVDDVCATGETLMAAAGALRQCGAAEVTALVLARSEWHL